MLVALNTEFTALRDPYLISIGLVSQAGEEFYAEVPYPRAQCSEFVREVVQPLLGHDPLAACADPHELHTRLLDWLSNIKRDQPVRICFDFETAWELFVASLDGAVPDFCMRRKVYSNEVNQRMKWDFWQKHPALHEHPALHDARALLHAMRLR